MNLELRVSDVWKAYDDSPVLQGASLSFDRNGIYVLMGENGSGKSTFLRLCAMLEEPDRGEIVYREGDRMLPRDIALKRRITLVLPRIGVFNKSVFANVAYGLSIRGEGRDDIRERVTGALDFVGLKARQDQNALTLSSGETQRLGIARAIVIDPEILFLDEPAAFVDSRNKAMIHDILQNLKRQGHSTVILTTHDIQQARLLADRMLRIDRGRIVPA
jgi:tungstate transport system ATP-binding protein